MYMKESFYLIKQIAKYSLFLKEGEICEDS
jgi:hypothetical protein